MTLPRRFMPPRRPRLKAPWHWVSWAGIVVLVCGRITKKRKGKIGHMFRPHENTLEDRTRIARRHGALAE